ncbi:pfs domain-containing protein [Colletotrichum zoysiae]|uniref:Pfs domain-containing protein n=1 Tax=Colletotrichum zoysiae TaxID=1216348 RepID=A0AAD9LXH2_9PEZI|nr:pfs domain-containing protein [Colletotrichum zoysiae]
MAKHTRPKRRDEFEVAVVCSLPLEHEAAMLAFDEVWAEDEAGDKYGKAPGDWNKYNTGRIGRCNVVLVQSPFLSGAANVAKGLKSSFTGIKLVLLTGICAGVPGVRSQYNREIMLGDVMISNVVVQYSLGEQYANHEFLRKNTLGSTDGRASKDARNPSRLVKTDHAIEEACNLFGLFETDQGRCSLRDDAGEIFSQIRSRTVDGRDQFKYQAPSALEDQLFDPGYVHMHRNGSGCGCEITHACRAARAASCDELQCDTARLVARDRGGGAAEKDQEHGFEIFVGPIGSGNQEIKFAADRDRIARKYGIFAYDTEGAGVWDVRPTIVVKGVCDYADSHNNRKWQTYAAATASSVIKALLNRYSQQVPRTVAQCIEFDRHTPSLERQPPHSRNHHLSDTGSSVASWNSTRGSVLYVNDKRNI